MKIRVLGFLAAVVVMAPVRPAVAQGGSQMTGCTTINWPTLPQSDPAYSDAMDLARDVTRNGFTVQCIAPSKWVAMFEGLVGAALYRTNRGSFEALFLPTGQNFDELQIVEHEESGRYLYSFAGYPKPWPANRVDGPRPTYFIKNRNRLIVAFDKEVTSALEPIFRAR